jgi:3'-phosphoadenosine 5'-phosphosulfate sulfotransferase (PAPS reductase)/FAD synthetase
MREKLKQARGIIENALNTSERPVVLCSFGKESLLLLALLRHYTEVDVLWYYTDDLAKAQKRFAHQIIRDWNLAVYTYQPSDRYYLPNDEGLTLVSEYSIGGEAFPVLQDIEHSDRCGLEISSERTPYFAYHWPVTFWGLKSSDEHFITGRPFVPDGTQVGSTRLYAPLRDFTDEDVWKLTRRLNLPFNEEKYRGDSKFDPDILHACTACFSHDETVFCPRLSREVPPFVWDKAQALDSFRTRFRA